MKAPSWIRVASGWIRRSVVTNGARSPFFPRYVYEEVHVGGKENEVALGSGLGSCIVHFFFEEEE